MAMTEKRQYPVPASDYRLLEEIGYGRNAVVYRALCVPFDEVVSIKVVDLEKCRSDLDEVRCEAATMSLIQHPNVVTAHAFLIVEQSLWVVMPYMAGGSFLTIMRSSYPGGLEQAVIATVLKECLNALEYLHFHGHIHRDIKAGNILVDETGAVKLGDFGVTACIFDIHNRQIMRRTTFVGTPCWMAPEVIDPVCGYDSKADIWSLGITALELAQGHAPFSNLPPMKVLQLQLHSPPPELEAEKSKLFFKSFKDFLTCCLNKEPLRRWPAAKLMKHPFFKHAHQADFLVDHILKHVPPLPEQVKRLRTKDAAEVAKRIALAAEPGRDDKKERPSWNFDINTLQEMFGCSSSAPKEETIPEEEEEACEASPTSSKPSTSDQSPNQSSSQK